MKTLKRKQYVGLAYERRSITELNEPLREIMATMCACRHSSEREISRKELERMPNESHMFSLGERDSFSAWDVIFVSFERIAEFRSRLAFPLSLFSLSHNFLLSQQFPKLIAD